MRKLFYILIVEFTLALAVCVTLATKYGFHGVIYTPQGDIPVYSSDILIGVSVGGVVAAGMALALFIAGALEKQA